MIAVVVVTAAACAAAAHPLTLVEATEIALRGDPGVARAAVDIERARLLTLTANLARVHVSVDASVQEIFAGGTSPFFDKQFGAGGGLLGLGNVQASVDAPLYSGGRVEADIARAEHLEHAAEYDLEGARRGVVLAVARAYWSERRLALLAEAQRGSDARLEDSERIVLARVNAGLAAGLDQNRAASRRAELDVQRASLVAQRTEARVRLTTVLGIDEPVELVDALPVDNATPGAVAAVVDVNALVQRALDARPELKAAELRGFAVDEEKRSAESAFFPQVGAFGLAQLGNNPSIAGAGSRGVGGGAIPFVGTAANLQAGVGVSINLFDTYATTHAVDDAAHRRRLADAETRALRRTVESDVRLASAKLASLREQRVVLARAEAIEADDVVILQKAYERGEVLLTELLDQQVRLSDAERQIVDVDAQLVLAQIELDVAVGDHMPGVAP